MRMFAIRGKMSESTEATKHRAFPFFFSPLDKTEVIFGEAKKRHLVYEVDPSAVSGIWAYLPEMEYKVYNTEFPYVKLFLQSAGFGIRKYYHNIFIELTAFGGSKITIDAPNIDHDFSFVARGNVLPSSQIAEVYGRDSNTFEFYSRQHVFSPSEYQKILKEERLPSGVITRKKRVLRR
jgi:hypothetical protein